MPDGSGIPRWERTLNWLQGRQRRYRAVFGTADGEWVLGDLYRRAGILRPAHVPGDPYSTAYQDGAQAMVKQIAKIMGEDADTMLKRAQQAAHDND